MTQKEKINMLKDTICFLYEKEGRNKSYISKLLNIDRKTLSNTINYEWKLEQGNFSYLTPSNQKFLNRHKNLIKSRLDRDFSVIQISEELKVTKDYLYKTIIKKDKVLSKAFSDYQNRKSKEIVHKREKQKENSSLNYNFKEFPNEEWKPILGYEDYYISNHGRVKKYIKTYNDYILIAQNPNVNNDRLYVWIGKKGLQVSRLVGFAFLTGYSETKNTINHKDGNVQNNNCKNLEWISQRDNNLHSYEIGRVRNKAFSRNGKFKKLIINDKYEFKTIRAFAKFIEVSESQAHRYINGEVKNNPYKIEFIY